MRGSAQESTGILFAFPLGESIFASLMRLCVIKTLTLIPVYDSIKQKETREKKGFFGTKGWLQGSRRGTHKPEVVSSILTPATII